VSSHPNFVTSNSGIAIADFIYRDYAVKNNQNYPIYKFKIIMKQQGDRHWEINDIQGIEDVWSAPLANIIRINDTTSISSWINEYLGDKNPNITTSNWKEVLSNYLLQKRKTDAIPEDPLSGNVYTFAIKNGNSLKNFSYVIRVNLSTIDNNTFKGVVYKDLSMADVIAKISDKDNNILGIDCTPPAYCYVSWGNESDWKQKLNK